MGHFNLEELKRVLYMEALMCVLILLCRATRFKGFRQQDSQELLRYLLDSIRNEEFKVLDLLFMFFFFNVLICFLTTL